MENHLIQVQLLQHMVLEYKLHLIFYLTSLTRSSPGSHILGIPASLTKAIDFLLLRSLIIFGILLKELCLLKLIRLFEI